MKKYRFAFFWKSKASIDHFQTEFDNSSHQFLMFTKDKRYYVGTTIGTRAFYLNFLYIIDLHLFGVSLINYLAIFLMLEA
jgi:hypothetical protein